jgi:hypothetical protein
MAGVITITQGGLQKARPYDEEGIQLVRETGSHWLVAMTDFGFGVFIVAQGNYKEARAQFEVCRP